MTESKRVQVRFDEDDQFQGYIFKNGELGLDSA